MESPPSKVVPQTVHSRIMNRYPRTKYHSHTCSPLCCQQSPAADCGLFAIAFATMLAYGEQSWTLPVRSKQVEATSAEVSTGREDDTTPIEEESA